MSRAKNKCTVADGTFLNPCDTLRQASGVQAPGSKTAGLFIRSLMHLPSHQPARRYAMLRSGQHKDTGIVVNFCPFCGANIARAFSAESKAALKWQRKTGGAE